jgi:hypothetical protein
MGQQVSHHVDRDADDDDVRERPEGRHLTEWNPPEEHEHADEDGRAADVEAAVIRNSLGKDGPGRVSEIRVDQRRLSDTEQPQTEE